MPTRWNSTLCMMTRLLRLNDTVIKMVMSEGIELSRGGNSIVTRDGGRFFRDLAVAVELLAPLKH